MAVSGHWLVLVNGVMVIATLANFSLYFFHLTG